MPRRTTCPPSPTHSRDQESADLADLLHGTRLVTITGPGGAGKTRLAIHVASRVSARFPDGVVYVALDALRESSLVAPAIVGVLGLEDDPTRSAADIIISYLAGKTVLLVLDNFEHVLDAANVVAKLLRSLPELRILVTSQALLAIQGENAYQLPPFAHPESVEFFVDRARAYDSAFSIEASDRAMIEELVNRLERMPLALELAAARVRLFGIEGLMNRVTQKLDLGSGPSDLPDRHRTLQAAIRWSYDLLDGDEQHVLRHLGAFDGGFTLDAAEAVAGSDSLTALASLIDKSLVRSTVTKGEARFAMLDSIRRFSIDELSDDERSAAATAHGEYFAQLAERARPEFEGDKQALWLDRFTVEHENLRAVARWALKTSRPDAGLRAVGAAWRFFHRRGHMPEARDRLRELLELEGASPAASAEGLNGLAGILYWQGEYTVARNVYEDLLARFGELGDHERIADTLFALSTTNAFLGDYATGSRFSQRARVAYEEADISDGVRRVHAAEALVAWQTGRLEEALPLWEQAHHMYADAADTAERLQTEIGIAALTHQLGRTDESIAQAGAILGELSEIDDVSGTIMMRDFLSAILAAVDPEPAVRLAGAAHRLRDELGGGLRPEVVGLKSAFETAAHSMTHDEIASVSDEG